MLELILDADANDTSFVFEDTWADIAAEAFTTNAIPSLWFYGSAVRYPYMHLIILIFIVQKGLTLISLSALGLIKWWKDFGTKYLYDSFNFRYSINEL